MKWIKRIITSSTPQTSGSAAPKLKFWRIKSARAPTPSPVPSISEEVLILPRLLEQGVTGADFSLPIFDGFSQDAKDHLIDLDTDSMERCPDVRVYFWQVGTTLRVIEQKEEEETLPHSDVNRPTDPELRLEWDSKRVTEGREYLRDSRAKGEGYYISSHRDITASNVPGEDWFRLPAIGIAKDLSENNAVASEGNFFDSWKYNWSVGYTWKTNIRVPILWTQMLKPGVEPGTEGWDDVIGTLYHSNRHPAHRAYNGSSRLEVISGVVTNLAGPFPEWPCASTLAGSILEEFWPGLLMSDTEEEDRQRADPEVVARLKEHTGDMDAFFGRKKKYRGRKCLGYSFR